MSKDDEAKDFLKGFLIQLAQSDKTNRDMLAVQRELLETQKGIFEQNNQVIRALSTVSNQIGHVSSQMDGLAHRLDYLYTQMGELGNILVNDGSPSLPLSTYPTQPPNPIESAVRTFARETFNGFAQGLRQGGGGRTRRR